jgi:hypothetical protein
MIREYVGAGPEAEEAAQSDALARQERLAHQKAWNQQKTTLRQFAARMRYLETGCRAVAFATLANMGCYLHNGAQWRIKGGTIKENRKAG